MLGLAVLRLFSCQQTAAPMRLPECCCSRPRMQLHQHIGELSWQLLQLQAAFGELQRFSWWSTCMGGTMIHAVADITINVITHGMCRCMLVF